MKPEEARWEVTKDFARLYGDSTPVGSSEIKLDRIITSADHVTVPLQDNGCFRFPPRRGGFKNDYIVCRIRAVAQALVTGKGAQVVANTCSVAASSGDSGQFFKVTDNRIKIFAHFLSPTLLICSCSFTNSANSASQRHIK